LGFALLIVPYLLGGMGAGDVKALAALGAWLGPWQTFILFFYMALAGGLISLTLLAWKGLLWSTIRRGWAAILNWILRRPFGESGGAKNQETQGMEGIPYGVAIALGMAVLCLRGPGL
ncbi:MAG: prepilin peptidase, partial [Deltaproteobacteria bacterium]|nr:prepilin peptidase [Deltaproteobacteria bacterium]